ncbi:ATP-binding protein, partial [Dietzia sp.]|uniref:ATP-binding protein n=1 Tax=Dietzia sp. TaxID=1871616 RepID=UPI002FDA58B7
MGAHHAQQQTESGTGDDERHAYPFSAIVGQESLRLALLLLAVDPRLGGVLIQGEKGTAKTTAVRGLAALLPGTGDDGDTDAHGAFVELPLSATEDRVVGSIDVHSLVADGAASLRPGLVSAADGGVLYVDEVNLLADNLVDVLLDAAATGRVTVERDGISASTQSRFALVGTMNPEEGELRPQLLDRFGLSVEVSAPGDAGERVEVITRRLAFDSDPGGFAAGFADAERAGAARIARARAALDGARIPLRELRRIAFVCLETEVQGLRADVVSARAAKAHAVLEGRDEVTEADVRAVASFVLPHRRRTDPFDSTGMSEEEIDAAFTAAARRLDELESAEEQNAQTDPGSGGEQDGSGDTDDT